MKSFIYNDMAFSIEKTGSGLDITRTLPNGADSVVGSGLFPNLPDGDARAQALVRTVFPVGIKIIGPDVAHPNTVGDLKIVGPDVGHPNFVFWGEDSTSFAK